MQKIRPFLWFDGRALEAARFYVSIFREARLLEEPDDDARSVSFELFGSEYIAFDGGPLFAFTPAISLFVTCATQDEVDTYWRALTEGGEPGRCGWLRDKFGVSWQVIPAALADMLGDPDDEKSSRVMTAMLEMDKLDIAALERAHAGR